MQLADTRACQAQPGPQPPPCPIPTLRCQHHATGRCNEDCLPGTRSGAHPMGDASLAAIASWGSSRLEFHHLPSDPRLCPCVFDLRDRTLPACNRHRPASEVNIVGLEQRIAGPAGGSEPQGNGPVRQGGQRTGSGRHPPGTLRGLRACGAVLGIVLAAAEPLAPRLLPLLPFGLLQRIASSLRLGLHQLCKACPTAGCGGTRRTLWALLVITLITLGLNEGVVAELIPGHS
mmetsp:Transcript_132745/g.230170  ORF Transcript_132745/g.230170 Transcript_132745/m.230170 type:complete len:232 (-) Transcript_132745:308-1003(-)